MHNVSKIYALEIRIYNDEYFIVLFVPKFSNGNYLIENLFASFDFKNRIEPCLFVSIFFGNLRSFLKIRLFRANLPLT